jgi:hypothetical protein
MEVNKTYNKSIRIVDVCIFVFPVTKLFSRGIDNELVGNEVLFFCTSLRCTSAVTSAITQRTSSKFEGLIAVAVNNPLLCSMWRMRLLHAVSCSVYY